MIVQDMLFCRKPTVGLRPAASIVASLAGVARAVVELHEAAIAKRPVEGSYRRRCHRLGRCAPVAARAIQPDRQRNPTSRIRTAPLSCKSDRLDGEIALRVVNEGRRFQPSICPICSTASTGQMRRGRCRRAQSWTGLGISWLPSPACTRGGRWSIEQRHHVHRAMRYPPARAIVNGSGTTNRLCSTNHFFQQEKRQKADKATSPSPRGDLALVCLISSSSVTRQSNATQTKRDGASRRGGWATAPPALQARPRSAARARARP